MLQGNNFKVVNEFGAHHLIKSGEQFYLIFRRGDIDSVTMPRETEYCIILKDLDSSIFAIEIDDAVLIDRLLNGWEVIERKLNSERSEW